MEEMDYPPIAAQFARITMDHEGGLTSKGCGCTTNASETLQFAESQNSKHQCIIMQRCVYLEYVNNANALCLQSLNVYA